MGQFIDVITTFPSVVFTVALLVSIGYWVIATVLGLDSIDADADFDVDLDFDLDSPGQPGGLSGLLTALDLHLMPISLVVSVISLVGWVVSVIASVLLGTDGVVGLVMGLVILAAAFAAGVLASGRVARLVAPIFSPARAQSHVDLLGRLCVVRTGRVDDNFGQAEVVDGEGAAHLIQVRCRIDNELGAGDQALLVDLEDGVFIVSPDVDAIR